MSHGGHHESENCQYCGFKTSTGHYLKKHIETKHQSKKYVCDKCSKIFTSKFGLSEHKKKIHEGRILKCETCGREFTGKSNLSTHVKAKHLGVKFECEFCDHIASRKEHLENHVKRVHNANQVTELKCSDCSYETKYKYNLKRTLPFREQNFSHMQNVSISIHSQKEHPITHRVYTRRKEILM